MRRRARVDANQPALVRELRRIGCSVQSIAPLGCGVPDLLVGVGHANWLLEVKDPAQPPSRRVLTPDEQEWHQCWRGQVAVIETLEQALRLLGIDGRIR